MDNLELIGKKIVLDNITYRIITKDYSTYILCELNTSKLHLSYYPAEILEQSFRNNTLSIIPEKHLIIDTNTMSSNELNEFNTKKEIMAKITSEYGPTYMGLIGKHKKPIIETLITTYGISRKCIWTYIRKYIQSGLNYISLTDARHYRKEHVPYEYKKKTGRPNSNNTISGIPLDNTVLKHFDEFLNYYKKGRERTIKNAYIGLISKYYSYNLTPTSTSMLPESKRPTYNQFYHYCKNNLSRADLDIIKTSKQEHRNSKRLILGSSRTDAIRPGWIVESDAWEADVSIISELNPEQSIGRPIVYMMIDVYSSAICAVSVSFENNSFVGLTNLMLNLMENKVDYGKKIGVDLDPKLFPSNFIPHEIRCDRGSDYKSDKFGMVCERLGINRTLEPGATGSYKGLIEQSFHQFVNQLKPNLENQGLITKRYNSNHHREAMLSLYTFTQMTLLFVLSHNQKIIKDYPMSKEMYKEKNFTPNPISLWEYGCKKSGAPKLITDANRSQYVFDLMIEKNATISKKGITLNNLRYINTNDPYLINKMYSLQNKREKFSIRYDPRDVERIYYMHDNQLFYASLNNNIPGNSDFAGLTWFQYDEFYKAKKSIINKANNFNTHIDFNLSQTYDWIIENSATKNYANDTNIREARAIEKQNNNYNNRLSTKLDIEDTEQTPEIDTTLTDNINISESTDIDEYTPNDDFLSALDNFEDEMRGL